MNDNGEVFMFNGKTVTVHPHNHDGSSDMWQLFFDNGSHMFILRPQFSTQLEMVQDILETHDAETLLIAENALVDVFVSDWKIIGGDAEIAGLVLDYLGYGAVEYAASVVKEAELTEEIRMVSDQLVKVLKEQAEKLHKAESGDFEYIQSVLRRIDLETYEAGEALAELNEAIQHEGSLRALMEVSSVGRLNWSNDSFFSQYGDTWESIAVQTLLSLSE
jgi:hypothetical protein